MALSYYMLGGGCDVFSNACSTTCYVVATCAYTSSVPGITRVGHVSRTYSELAGRTGPTASDVEAALTDCQLSTRGLEEYAKRPERRHVQRREKTPIPLLPPLLFAVKPFCALCLLRYLSKHQNRGVKVL